MTAGGRCRSSSAPPETDLTRFEAIEFGCMWESIRADEDRYCCEAVQVSDNTSSSTDVQKDDSSKVIGEIHNALLYCQLCVR